VPGEELLARNAIGETGTPQEKLIPEPSPCHVLVPARSTHVTYRVQSIERGVEILLVLAAGPATLTEIVRATGLSKATAYRLLVALGYKRMVVKDPNNLYFLGPGSMTLARGADKSNGWIGALAKPALTRLAETTRETVTVHVRAGHDRICIDEVPSSQPIRYTATVGALAPLSVGSAGRILLASIPPEECARLIAELELPSFTAATINDRETLRREVALTRKRGWATSSGERVPGARSFSVPITTLYGTVAVLSVLGPKDRLPPERQPSLLAEMRRATEEIAGLIAEIERQDNPLEVEA
jgi:DNA-binding IclR family transcriptional regulator